MPLFKISDSNVKKILPTGFRNEKQLQNLVEQNLIEIFNCRFVASEFRTGRQHGGRIDTLALSEDNNPVIIEYKCVESSQLINQSLYYLFWLKDHKGDFEKAANSTLKNIIVDWSDIRVICIAPSYAKYDIHAAQVMGAKLELWQFKLYQNEHMYFEEVLAKSMDTTTELLSVGKNPKMIAAGKKAALARISGIYTFEEHYEKASKQTKEIVDELREFITSLDNAVIEKPKKLYLAYKISQNFVCMEIKANRIVMYLKININKIGFKPVSGRDVTNIGHYGTGNFEYTITSTEQIEEAKKLIALSFNNIGG